MSESAQHQQLANMIIDKVIDIVGKDNQCFIMSDMADGYELSPLMAEGYRPDVYYQYKNTLIIGEAKTSKDVPLIHSRLQYESYIKKCSLFSGNSILIVAVPWTEHAMIHNILRKLKLKYPGNYKIQILDGMGGAI